MLLLRQIIIIFIISLTLDTNGISLNKGWKFNSNSSYQSDGIFVKHFNYYQPGGYLPELKVVPGQTYKLSFQVKNISKSKRCAYYVHVKLAEGYDKFYSISKDVFANQKVKDEFIFTIPTNYSGETAEIELFSRVTGEGLIYSDLQLEKIKRPPVYKLNIISPAYRQSIYKSKPVKTIAGYIEAPNNIQKIKVTLSKDGKVIKSSAGRKFSFDKADQLEDGKYQIKAELFDSNNKQVKKITGKISVFPKSKVEVVAGQDNLMYINGKVFFPLAIAPPRNISKFSKNYFAYIEYSVSQGVNMLRSSAKSYSTLKRILEHAENHGYKIMLNMCYFGSRTQGDLDNWKAFVKDVLRPDILESKALFGYMLKDEPAVKGEPLKPLILAYEQLKAYDPYRPIWINAAPHGTVSLHREYSRAADIYGVDVYPVGRWNHGSIGNVKSLTCVGEATKLFVEAVQNRKPIWFWLQGYSWKKNPKQAIYPDQTQLRFMLYDTILNGTTGLLYYGLYTVYQKGFMQIIAKNNNEIHSMSSLFAKANFKDKAYGNIKTRLYEYNGKQYLLALNYSNKQQKIKFSYLSNNKINVYFENRQINVNKNKFTDDFKPFGVHIYGTDSLPAPLTRLIPYNNPVKNPFEIFVNSNLQSIQTSNKLNWIWAQGQQVKDSKIWLAKPIVIRKKVKKATLLVTCDNKAQIYINKKRLGTTRSWTIPIRFDVTPYLSRGEHFLQAYAKDVGGAPCGLLAQIKIEYEDGRIHDLFTDSSWYAKSATNTKPHCGNNIKTQWEKASIIAKFGGGRWKGRVKWPKDF